MKKVLVILLAILLLTGIFPPVSLAAPGPAASLTAPDTIANIFPDPALARAVADRLGGYWSWERPTVTPNSVVTQDILDRISHLWVHEVQSLQGMQYLRNLGRLSARDGSFSDLRPLAGLSNLEHLWLERNEISDLTSLVGLPNLTYLGLRHNQISDPSPLARLPRLTYLNLSGNQISNLALFAQFSNLEALDLGWNQISDLTPLPRLPALTYLWLDGNQISNLTPLAQFTNLIALSLNENQISDPTPIRGLVPNLEHFDMWNQSITLPPVSWSDTLAHTVVVRPFAPTLFIVSPSDEGTFDFNTGRISWRNLPPNQRELSYSWVAWTHEDDSLGRFTGTVTIPLVDFPFFPDVPPGAWYREAVEFVHDWGLMTGVRPDAFVPNGSLSRAMLATILWRMAGEPWVGYWDIFHDVPPGRWYSEAVTWAYLYGIVQGISPDTFAPEGNITREQFATMLYRFTAAMWRPVDVPDSFSLADSPDYAQISPWAMSAMRWAVYNRLITGTDTLGTLNPGGLTTRAQCAVILHRFMMGV